MKLLSMGKFRGHVIICDPVYVISNVIDTSNKPKLEQYVPVECSDEMLRNDEISLLYRYGMEDYYYELEQWKKSVQSDWDRSDYGRDLKCLGFKNFIISELGYQYGSYGVYESNTRSYIGQFCSDSGLVGVFELDEVLSYDENFDKFNTMPYAVCFIPNYAGKIAFVNNNDESGIEADIEIIGKGNIDFYSKQIGF